MPRVIYLGRNVKEYEEKSEEMIEQYLEDKEIICGKCLKPMRKHSKYPRMIKDLQEELMITMVWCRKCKKWEALLPDFLMPYKHYSGNEIESVIIDSKDTEVIDIETEASELTVKRWINELYAKIIGAIAFLKHLFRVNEIESEPKHCYDELEDVLEKATKNKKYSGNKLGLANIWLMANSAPFYI